MVPLEGTLEIVVLRGAYTNDSASGIIDRNQCPIYVANGRLALERKISEVLVRTDTQRGWPNGSDIPGLTAQTGNFITSTVPQAVRDLGWLNAESYLLVGALNFEDGYLPSLDEINQIFDPGHIGIAIYFLKRVYGKLINQKNEPLPSLGSYQEAIDLNSQTNPRKHSRVILVRSEEQLLQLEDAIRSSGLIPVRMEPLRRTVELKC